MKGGKGKKAGTSTPAPSMFEVACRKADLSPAPGLQALKAVDKSFLAAFESKWTGSVDLDTHFATSEPNATRWDYGAGLLLSGGEGVVWLEPHPASSTGNVQEMINKKQWLEKKLALWSDLRMLTGATQKAGYNTFVWLTGSTVAFKSHDRYGKSLSLAGLSMPRKAFQP